MAENAELRDYAKEKGVKMWEVAEALRIADCTLSRRLRRKLSPNERTRFIAAVDHLAISSHNAEGVQ